jgi:hypothetical protein
MHKLPTFPSDAYLPFYINPHFIKVELGLRNKTAHHTYIKGVNI